MIIAFDSGAFEDYKTWAVEDKKIFARIGDLIKDITRDGFRGIGKPHIAQAIGLEACLNGFDVLYRSTHDLFRWVNAGSLDGSWERRLTSVKGVQVLILDDFGLQALNGQNQEDLYDLIAHRHERMTTFITSNRDFKEWPQVFANQLMGSAARDRLVHRALRPSLALAIA